MVWIWTYGAVKILLKISRGLYYQCLIPMVISQVQALSSGIANLLQISQDVCVQVQNVVQKGGGGVSSCKRWGVGDLEFEALMRMLDSQVRHWLLL